MTVDIKTNTMFHYRLKTYTFIRWILGTVFIVAGVIKLTDPEAFAVTIDAFGLLPESMVFPLALFLPVLEIAAAIGLFFDYRGSLELITGLLLVFIAVVLYAIYLGLDIDCGCFGPEDPESRAFGGLRRTLLRDIGMLIGVTYLFIFRKRRKPDEY